MCLYFRFLSSCSCTKTIVEFFYVYNLMHTCWITLFSFKKYITESKLLHDSLLKLILSILEVHIKTTWEIIYCYKIFLLGSKIVHPISFVSQLLIQLIQFCITTINFTVVRFKYSKSLTVILCSLQTCLYFSFVLSSCSSTKTIAKFYMSTIQCIFAE